MRRWIEQSLSNRCTTPPWLSAKICTSMCLGLRTACSRNTLASPNELFASLEACSIASARFFSSATLRIPLPPPPATALTNNGNPIFLDALISSVTSSDEPEDRSTGTFARVAAAIAFTLFPASSKTSELGPINVMPFSFAATASSGFSERKP